MQIPSTGESPNKEETIVFPASLLASSTMPQQKVDAWYIKVENKRMNKKKQGKQWMVQSHCMFRSIRFWETPSPPRFMSPCLIPQWMDFPNKSIVKSSVK